MAAWRKLHLKSVESQDIQDMPDDFTRLLWLLLPLGLDKEGRGLDNPSWIHAKVMPLRDDVDTRMITNAIDWFADHKMIVRYEVEGRKYFYIPTWHTYQKTDREAVSNFPEPLASNSRVNHEQCASKSSLDIDIDVDIDKDIDIDNQNQEFSLVPLVEKFTELTKISEFSFKPRDFEDLREMYKAGVTADDMQSAIRILQDKQFTIAGPGSVKKTALSEMSKRLNGKSKPPGGVGVPIYANGPGVAL